MKIAITGPTSFLGAAFAAAARGAGHQVIAVTRRHTAALDAIAETVVQRDVRTVTAADFAGADAVVHFATGSDGAVAHIIDIAVGGTLKVLAAAREAGVRRLIHVSSMSVYPGPLRTDPAVPGGFVLEDHPDWRGVYAQSKTAAELALYKAIADDPPGPMEIVVLRPGLVFGRDMKDPLAGTAAALPLGLTIALGRRDQAVPFVDIDDLTAGMVDFIATAPQRGAVRVFDVLSGAPPTKRALIEAWRRLGGQPCRTLWIPRWMAHPPAWLLDRALAALRRQPRHLAYKLDRMFRFEAADLPRDGFWQAVHREPQGSLRRSLAAALTIDRVPPPEAGGAQQYAARAGALLDCAARSSPAANPARLILVGAGRIVEEMHVPAIRALRNVTVTAVVDPDGGRAAEIARHFAGARTAADVKALDDLSIDGAHAVIATPGHSHAAIGQALLARGASLLMEKPVALDRAGMEALTAAATHAGRPVTVFKNYRLRPGALALWRFLTEHNVGALVAGRVLFHAPRLTGERARWMMEERRFRVLPLEQAIHFVDIACVVGGALTGLDHLAVTRRAADEATVAIRAAGRTTLGAALELDFDLSGTASRTRVSLQFERCAVELDFYPDSFRVLPRRATPIDDMAADAARFGAFAWSRLRLRQDGVPKRALPHYYIYRRHLAAASGAAVLNPFALDGIGDTMRSLYLLCERAY